MLEDSAGPSTRMYGLKMASTKLRAALQCPWTHLSVWPASAADCLAWDATPLGTACSWSAYRHTCCDTKMKHHKANGEQQTHDNGP